MSRATSNHPDAPLLPNLNSGFANELAWSDTPEYRRQLQRDRRERLGDVELERRKAAGRLYWQRKREARAKENNSANQTITDQAES